MEPCTIYDCEWDWYYPGVIIDNKVYVLDEEKKPKDAASLAWNAWNDLLPLMQFFTGIYDKKSRESISAKWGFFHLATGEIVIPPLYDEAYPYYGARLAKVVLNKRTGFIDETGQVIGGIVWDEVHTFNMGALCAVRKGDFWGCINLDGKLVFEPQFEEIGRWQVLFERPPCINPSREEVLRQASSKVEYVAWVKKNGKYGYIDDKGNYLVEPLYDVVRDFWAYHYAPVKLDKKWGVIDRTGKLVIPPIFADVGREDYGVYVVNQEGTWGVLRQDLKILMPEKGTRYVIVNGEMLYLKNGKVTSRRKRKRGETE